MKTRITELLDIEYPIFQGGMAWVADGDLAGAVYKSWRFRNYRWWKCAQRKLLRRILTRSKL